MRVSKLINGDWTFGKGLGNYIANNSAIRQNVVTRLRSFANDWFLDTSANIDWLNILGVKNNQAVVESEIRRVILATDGVLTIDNFEITGLTKRELTISLQYTTIFDGKIKDIIGITV